MVAEFAYGGYFKGAIIRPGVTEIELISQVPLGNVHCNWTTWLTIGFFRIISYVVQNHAKDSVEEGRVDSVKGRIHSGTLFQACC